MKWKVYESNHKKLFTNEEVSFIMIKVPDCEFYIGETPVTQELWKAVLGNNPSYFTETLLAPVENISHDDCIRFIEKLNHDSGESFRLPSIEEWYLAANCGPKKKPFLYAGSDNPEEVGWFSVGTHPVRLKMPNSIGLFDMTGNVWEWCSSEAPVKTNTFGHPLDFIIKKDGSIQTPKYYYLKGGSHANGYRTSQIDSTCAFPQFYRNNHIGMRLAM